MPLLSKLVNFLLFAVMVTVSFAKTIYVCDDNSPYFPPCDKKLCCGSMGGINYCDSSAGRYVCNNGYYSSCYCTRHAVMDLQKLQGCCLWQGGVFKTDEISGAVLCNNGSVSETCSFQFAIEDIPTC